MPDHAVLLIGDVNRSEMRPIAARFQQAIVCRDLAEFELRLGGGLPPPELVIVCESWPDEFPAHQVTRLLTAVPLARVVCVSGAWCESAGRTRSHWPPALRIPVWDAWARIEQELKVIAGERAALPITATRDECVLDAATTWESVAERLNRQVRLEIADAAMARELVHRLERCGWTVVSDPAAPVTVVVVQAEPSSPEVLRAIAERCRSLAPTAVYAVTTWPLPEWTEQLHVAGVQYVINPLAFAGVH